MKKYLKSVSISAPLFVMLLLMFSSCITEEIGQELDEELIVVDPIVGKWFLKTVNETDVSDVNCYEDSFIESDATEITFLIIDRLENGACETVLNNTQELTIEDDFYYLGNEALDFNIDNNVLIWRVDTETTLEFKK